mmetsp:Transcript_30807/g.88514  ORF Transcript_30807/g.88514 Transcript_30807/m.88514 type:complete len:202 (+) Transcript_30807:266-871(+)
MACHFPGALRSSPRLRSGRCPLWWWASKSPVEGWSRFGIAGLWKLWRQFRGCSIFGGGATSCITWRVANCTDGESRCPCSPDAREECETGGAVAAQSAECICGCPGAVAAQSAECICGCPRVCGSLGIPAGCPGRCHGCHGRGRGPAGRREPSARLLDGGPPTAAGQSRGSRRHRHHPPRRRRRRRQQRRQGRRRGARLCC